jgi:60 kDa SS-A/Ro ribonucleoprotein
VWHPVQQVVDALNDAFYLAFDNVVATGKRHMLALDVSGSMTWGVIAGVPGVTPNVAAATMAMATARAGDPYMVFGFGTQFMPLPISAQQRLDDIVRSTSRLNFGGTDCSLPMLYALQNRLEVDTFCVYTDNETWAGRSIVLNPRRPDFRIQPVQALAAYREKMGIDAKLVVAGMTATEFTIADPGDPGMMDVVGFDTAAPALISEFSAGRV